MSALQIVCTCVCLALELVAWYLVMRYNMHMFQQNTYLSNEHLAWLGQNWMRQDILLVQLATAFVAMRWGFGLAALPHALVLCFVVYYYRFLKGYLSKKPLVFTKRVVRMVATDAILSIAALAWGFGAGGLMGAALAASAAVTAQPLLVMLANLINTPVEKSINRYYLNDARRLLAQNPNLTVIGVTGSFGKTSVKFYLQTLLQDFFEVLVTPGNFNTPLGITRTVRSSLKPTHELFVCEMGARYTGEIKEICDLVHPTHGVICAIGPQHLETFGSIENIAKTKYELGDALPDGGMLFLNFDNDLVRERADRYDNVVSYGTDNDQASYRAADVSLSSNGTSFTIEAPDGTSERFDMRLVGKHNVVNVAGAIAVAHELGIALADLRVPVRRIRPVSHRMEMVDRGWATVIDDAYNSNPIGSRAAVDTLALFEGTRILITPGMVELGADQARYNREFGAHAAKCCDYVVIVGKENREALQAGALEGGIKPNHCRTFSHVEDAMQLAQGIDEGRRKFVLLENDLPDIY